MHARGLNHLVTYAVMAVTMALSGRAMGDRIVFVDKLEVEGTLLEQDEESVLVEVPYGNITLKRSRIKTIEIDFDARVRSLDKSDTRGFYRLGLLCQEFDMEGEAMKAYESAAEHDDAPLGCYLKLADLYEKKDMPLAAIGVLEKFVARNPTRADIIDRIAKLDLKVPEGEKAKLTEAVERPAPGETTETTTKATTAATDTKAVETEKVEPKPDRPKVTEGLEGVPGWGSEEWGNSAEVVQIEQGEIVKNKLLSVTFNSNDKGKVAVKKSTSLDLTEKVRCVFDVYNATERPLPICLAVTTLPGYVWFESTTIYAKPKSWKAKAAIDLTGKHWKCEASNWRFTAEIANRENVKQVFLLVYNTSKDGTVFFDNIFFQTAEEAAASK